MITPEKLAKDSEHSHQVALFCWAAQSGIPQLKWLFAVPNGFFASPGQKAKMKAEGLRTGVPDIWLPVPSTDYGWSSIEATKRLGLCIELKVGKNKTSAEQDKWIDYLNSIGYKAVVCYGWLEAKKAIEEYLNVN